MKRTAIVYDDFNLRHTLEGHPENYRRLQETWSLLKSDGILTTVEHLPSIPAPRDAILRVHSHAYIDRLQSIAMMGGGRIDADTYANVDSYDAALLAAGGVIELVTYVLRGKADNGFALIRPPGHHAVSKWGMGFCLLSNAAIAARWAQDRYGVERVLIVDFDVHHGNGTQDIFYDDPSVLFFSVHQYPHYPGTGAADEMGTEAADGMTVNVPLPARVGDAGYQEVFQRMLIPVARAFRPDLILLSAGYDGHWMDPLASMRLSVTGYGALVETVMALADELCAGKLVCVLEGGYHLQVLSHAVLSTLRVLSGNLRGVSDPFGVADGREEEIAALMEGLCDLHGIPEPPFYSLPSA